VASGKKFPLVIVMKTVDRATAGIRRVGLSVKGAFGKLTRLRASITRIGQSKAFQRLGNSVRRVGRGLRFAAKGVGVVGAALGVVGRKVFKFEDTFQRVTSQARFGGKAIDKFRGEINELSKSTGISREQLVAGADVMVNKLGAASIQSTDRLKVLATAIQATGADTEDLAGLMLAFRDNLGLKTAPEIEQMLSALDAIGVEGSVPLKQLAANFGPLTGIAKEFRQEGVAGGIRLASAMQVLAGTFTEASEQVTALRGAMVAMTRKGPQIKKMFNVDVADSEGRLRGLFEIIKDIRASGGSLTDIINVFGRVEGGLGVQIIAKEFERLEKFAAAGEKGVKEGFLNVRAMERASSEVGKMEAAWNRLSVAAAELFTAERVKKLTKAFERFVDIVLVGADNMGAVLAGLALIITSKLIIALNALTIALIANPVGLVIAGIVVLIGTIAFLVTRWDEMSARAKAVIAVMVAMAGPVGVVIAQTAALVRWAISIISNWGKIESFFGDMWEGIKGAFQSAWDFIRPILDAIIGQANFVIEKINDVNRLVTGEPAFEGGRFLNAGDVGGGRNETNAKVTVAFENTPPGARVTADRRSTADLTLTSDSNLHPP
jgi:hypothetical protein